MFRDRAVLLEWFATANLAFLAVDIYVAHMVNAFRDPLEWLPVLFSAVAPLLLIPGLVRQRGFTTGLGRTLGLGVGAMAIAVGTLGLLLHLNAVFLEEQTLKALVYTAPFIAPAAYTAIGFLLLLNRLVDVQSPQWERWVLFFSMAGFASNFVLSLQDHAQNGFFYAWEWIPVAAAAFGVAFLAVALVVRSDMTLLRSCLVVMGLQIVVAIVGFFWHAHGLLDPSPLPLFDRIVFGAPVFAPLLFADIALLGALGLWGQATTRGEPTPV